MKTILLTLTLIWCYDIFSGTCLRGVLCTIVQEGLRHNEHNDHARWNDQDNAITLQSYEKLFDSSHIDLDHNVELYDNSIKSDQKRFSKKIYTDPISPDIKSFKYFNKQPQRNFHKLHHQKQHRRRHNRKRRLKNTKHSQIRFKSNYNDDFHVNDPYGYVVDTNNQRFIRQAARSSTRNQAAFAMPNPTNTNFNNPVLSPSISLPSSTQLNYTWPLKRSVDLEGDILLGGLHMVHERNVANICGTVMGQGGVQAVETMLHAIDYVNNEMAVRGEWIKNVTLGAHILDDCDTDTYGLEMAVDFIKGNCPFFINK